MTDFALTKFGLTTAPPEVDFRKFRVRHDFYHHGFAPNYDGFDQWGSRFHRFCTNKHGFKDACGRVVGNTYDVAFIGDSITEAVGLTYEESFVGRFAAETGLSVANLGVVFYSPKVYFTKVSWLLDHGVRFKHLIVFLDISDIDDDLGYAFAPDGSIINRGTAQFWDSNEQETEQQETEQQEAERQEAEQQEVERQEVEQQETENREREEEVALILGGRTIEEFIADHFYFSNLAYRYAEKRINADADLRPPLNLSEINWTYDSSGDDDFGPNGLYAAIESSKSYMEKLYTLAMENGIKFSVGVYPWPDQIFNDTLVDNKWEVMWREFCRERCVKFIDTFPAFDALRNEMGAKELYRKYFIEGDSHLNAAGNGIIFRVLSEEFRSYSFE